MCALQWGDISLESGTIRIHKTMLRILDLTPDARRKTKVLIDCPKTESSNRVIPMPSFLMALVFFQANAGLHVCPLTREKVHILCHAVLL